MKIKYGIDSVIEVSRIWFHLNFIYYELLNGNTDCMLITAVKEILP